MLDTPIELTPTEAAAASANVSIALIHVLHSRGVISATDINAIVGRLRREAGGGTVGTVQNRLAAFIEAEFDLG